MKLERKPWGDYQGHPAEIFTVSDPESGFLVQFSDFGATLVRVMVPDRNGHVDDVNFGQNNPTDFIEQGGYLGAVVGRTANRIGNATFELDGKKYNLFVNNCNVHSLHGGKIGFNAKFWECMDVEVDDSEAVIKFRYVSQDGEESYPGTLTTTVTYTIKPMELTWIFEATTDKSTIINLTNHAYWNLDGLTELIDDQSLRVNADKYMPGDETLIPTGEVLDVSGTGYDFRQAKKFSEIFATQGDIDNNFILNKEPNYHDEPQFAAEVISPKTGRIMKVYTTEPCIQVYTANFMGNIVSFGKQCQKHGAICLETQRVPNAINFPEFRESMILRPEQRYVHKTVHKFSLTKIIEDSD